LPRQKIKKNAESFLVKRKKGGKKDDREEEKKRLSDAINAIAGAVFFTPVHTTPKKSLEENEFVRFKKNATFKLKNFTNIIFLKKNIFHF
jgi:hypothetical protein